MNKYAIIVAGGSGTRMGANVPKQFLTLRDMPLLWYPITAFLNAFQDIKIILVLPEAYLAEGKKMIESFSFQAFIDVVAGGDTRFHSVKNGLALVPANCVVFIHDGVRCLVTPALIQRCYDNTITKGNAIPAIPAVDTIRIETANGSELVDRTKLKIIQTPQTFISDQLKKAFKQAYRETFTDDASVVETIGEKINLVEGDATNIKITRKIDLLIAEQILLERDNS